MTGKPPSIGGLRGRGQSSGVGAYYALKEFLKSEYILNKYNLEPGLRKKKVILEGFGNVGQHISR